MLSIFALSEIVTPRHMWLWCTWNEVSVTQELYFFFNLMLIDLDCNSHMWLLAAVLDRAYIEHNSASSH